jgi:DNA-binding beta-propeller fold protein YncE
MTGALDMAMTPDGSLAYVAWRGGVVSAMDVATSEQLYTVGVGATPSDVALTPDGRLLVSTWADELVAVDTRTRAVSGRLPIPRLPDRADAVSAPGSSEMVVTPDGSRAVLTRGEAGVTTVDLRTGAVASGRPLTGSLGHVALLPDGTMLLTRGDEDSVDAIDPVTGALLWSVPVSDAREIAVAPGGATAYVVSPVYGSVAAVDVAGRRHAGIVSPGLDADDVAVDATGRRLAVSDPTGRVVLLDVATGAPLQQVVTDRQPMGMAFTPDGRRLVVVSAHPGVGYGARSVELRA